MFAIFSPTCVLSAVITFLVVVLLYTKFKHGTFSRLGVPGPRPTPVLGMLYTYIKKGIVWTDVELVKRYGRIVGIYHGHSSVMLVAKPEMIEQICEKRTDVFINRASMIDMGCTLRPAVALADDSHWKFLRSKIARIFSPEKLQEVTCTVHECVDDLIDNIKNVGSDGKSFDVTRVCCTFSMDVLLRTVFGKKVNSCNCPDDEMVVMALKSWTAGTSGVKAKGLMCAVLPSMKQVFKMCQMNILPKEVVEYFSRVTKTCINERNQKHSEHKDFLKFLMENEIARNNNNQAVLNENQRDLTEQEIRANLIFFIMAGYDTTASALGFLGHCLATNPKCQDKVLQEIDLNIGENSVTYNDVMGNKLPYLDMVVSETLRLFPPFVRFNRRAEKDITIEGQYIPCGMEVTIPVFAMHRDSQIWKDPDLFNPERFSPEAVASRPKYSYLPFGVGPRNCLGSKFALLQIKMAAVRLLQQFSFCTTPATEAQPVLQKSGFVKPENGIWLKIEPR